MTYGAINVDDACATFTTINDIKPKFSKPIFFRVTPIKPEHGLKPKCTIKKLIDK